MHQAGDVAGDHRVPVIPSGVLRGVEAERAAGIVDEQVDGAEIFGDGGEGSFHRGAVADVEIHQVRSGLGPRGQVFQLLRIAAGKDELATEACEGCGEGLAEIAGRAGDQNCLHHRQAMRARKMANK